MSGARGRDSLVTKTGLSPSIGRDNFGPFISIVCGSAVGQLYLGKLDEYRRSQGKCVLVSGKWYTPTEFEIMGGKKARKWKQSLQHLGKPLSDYNLSCAQCSQSSVESASASALSHVPSVNSVTTGTDCSLLVDTVLSFVKAYRLKGDNNSLKNIVGECFSTEAVEGAKKLLWDNCKQHLEGAGLPYQARRDSEKRSQIAANIDDILRAFESLDSGNLIPPIYSEAVELLRVPPLSLDPVAEQVQSNSNLLQAMSSAVDALEKKLTSFLESSTASCKSHDQGSHTYAAAASLHVPPSVGVSASLHSNRHVSSVKTVRLGGRGANLILFGLAETKSIVDTKALVDEILEFLIGRSILIKDIFRLGKYTQTSIGSSTTRPRPRPLLLKLSTAWGRKLVLSSKRKLKDFRVEHLYLREDVPPDHRILQGNSKLNMSQSNLMAQSGQVSKQASRETSHISLEVSSHVVPRSENTLSSSQPSEDIATTYSPSLLSEDTSTIFSSPPSKGTSTLLSSQPCKDISLLLSSQRSLAPSQIHLKMVLPPLLYLLLPLLHHFF